MSTVGTILEILFVLLKAKQSPAVLKKEMNTMIAVRDELNVLIAEVNGTAQVESPATEEPVP